MSDVTSKKQTGPFSRQQYLMTQRLYIAYTRWAKRKSLNLGPYLRQIL